MYKWRVFVLYQEHASQCEERHTHTHPQPLLHNPLIPFALVFPLHTHTHTYTPVSPTDRIPLEPVQNHVHNPS